MLQTTPNATQKQQQTHKQSNKQTLFKKRRRLKISVPTDLVLRHKGVTYCYVPLHLV
eukprot:m.10561 g.10561  ORF g.10561 m.10561 type:complete len:57 (+) comp6638_c0_seq2:5796-5966(+)